MNRLQQRTSCSDAVKLYEITRRSDAVIDSCLSAAARCVSACVRACVSAVVVGHRLCDCGMPDMRVAAAVITLT